MFMKHQKLMTTPEISKRMSKVKLKKNDVETKLAKALWHKGFRYRLNYKKLPGSPDIVLTKYYIAIFVDGEFWHGKDFEKRKETLKNNKKFWIEKIEENISRDNRNDVLLNNMGWIPLHFWSKDVENNLDVCVDEILEYASYQMQGRIIE